MSEQNPTEDIVNSESISESIEGQDQNSLNDQERTESGTEDEVINENGISDNVEEVEIEDEEMKKFNEDDEIENEAKDVEDDKIKEETEIEDKEKLDEEIEDKKADENNKIDENNEESKEENVKGDEEKSDNKDEKSKEENKEKEKSKNSDDTKSEENKKEESDKNSENKKSEKEDTDNNSSNKRGSYSNNYYDKGYNGRFNPRGYQYGHHPYDDYGRRRGGMNYPPYYEKDRRHGMRNDFRGRDYRDFYDMRMGRDFRGFRDRDRDFDYPKFYGRGRDQRFFNKRDRDFKYKRDYYDNYNRNMDKDMRMNNSMKECRVYVQNLSYDVTTEMLSRFMEKVGKVVSVEILTSPDGRSKGCALVQYETPSEARRAISDLQDNQFQGRPIHIREDREGMQYNSQMMDKSYMNDKQMGYQGEGGASNYQNNINNTPKEQRIFVGNLDVNVTANDLRTLFEPAGTINYADVFQKDRNQPSKHGIIGFQDSSSIKKAIEMFNGVLYRNRKLDVHEDRRGIVPTRRFNSYKSDKNMSIHNAGHHPYQPNSKPYPPGRGGKGNGPYNGKFNNRQPPPHHQSMQNSQQKLQQPPLPPHPSNSNTQDKSNGNNYMKNQSHISYNQQQNSSVTYPAPQSTTQHNSQTTAPMPYAQGTTQAQYMQHMAATYSQPTQSTYAQPQGVQQAASVPLYAGYTMTDQNAANAAAYQSSYQTAAYYSSISHQAQPVAIPTSQPVQQPYPVATNVDYNNIYSAYYGQTSQVGASGYPMMTQSTTTTTAQGQPGYTEGSTLPTTYPTYY